MAAIPVSDVRDMDIREFNGFFDERVVREKYMNAATVLGLVKVFKSIDEYNGRDPGEINEELWSGLDAGFARGVPVALRTGEAREASLINYQYREGGPRLIRAMTLESWGLRAIIYQARDEGDTPRDVLYLKPGRTRRR
jgi:hypothetical protein